MHENYGYQYGFVSTKELDGEVRIGSGQFVSGYAIGILIQDVHYPLIPGNVANASTFRYPVRMEIVKGANQKRVHTYDETLLDELKAACKRLESQGVRAITGACGYFGHFQKEASKAVHIPMYLSSIMQIPWIRAGLRDDDEIGILCADIGCFTDHLFDQCGVGEEDKKRCRIAGAGNLAEFSALLERRGSFNNHALEGELVSLAKELKLKYPRIRAILLECSDMPPYAAAIQKAIQLPVYDYITMINFIYSSVAHRPFYGFI